MRRIIDAVLMATLVKPVAHRMVARWRRRARESAATTISIPVQELLEAALLEELAAPTADLRPSTEEMPEQLPGRGLMRTMIIAGVTVAVMAVAAVAVRTMVRRRRETRAAQGEDAEWVAVPVDEAIEPATSAAEEALTG